jgi:hypothetical protein
MRCPACLLVAAALLASAPIVSAQSLAAVAKKEKARRETVKDSGKTFTNADLKPAPPPQVVSSGDGTSKEDAAAADAAKASSAEEAANAASADSAADDKAADEKGATQAGSAASGPKDEAYWRGRISEQRAQLDRDRLLAEALQTRINSLTTDFVNRDDPAQRSVIATDREKALAELQRMKKAVEDDQKAMAAIEEEARRAGVPAGWLR